MTQISPLNSWVIAEIDAPKGLCPWLFSKITDISATVDRKTVLIYKSGISWNIFFHVSDASFCGWALFACCTLVMLWVCDFYRRYSGLSTEQLSFRWCLAKAPRNCKIFRGNFLILAPISWRDWIGVSVPTAISRIPLPRTLSFFDFFNCDTVDFLALQESQGYVFLSRSSNIEYFSNTPRLWPSGSNCIIFDKGEGNVRHVTFFMPSDFIIPDISIMILPCPLLHFPNFPASYVSVSVCSFPRSYLIFPRCGRRFWPLPDHTIIILPI